MLKYKDFKEKIQPMFYPIHKYSLNSRLFAEKRLCPKTAEKPGAIDEKPEDKSKIKITTIDMSPEKPKVHGLPIDTEPKKEKLALEAKKNLSDAEKKITDKYGGAVFEMDKQPHLKEKGYKDQVYVNVPQNMDKFIGPDGQPKKPRIVYYFHGNGGSIEKDAANTMKMVEEMRAKGDPVILVMPQDRNGNWKDYDKPEAFKDVVKMAEQITGVPVSRDISFGSHSGGYQGIGKTLAKLKSQSQSDPEAQELYSRIRQIALFDSAYGYHQEIVDWAADKNNMLSSNYTGHLEAENNRIEKAIRDARGGNMTGIHFEPVKGNHGDSPQVFAEFLKERKSGQETEKTPDVKLTGGPRLPERSKDALSGTELMEAYKKCQNDEERRKLFLNQLALGNVPYSWRNGFRKVTVEKNGNTFEFMVAPSGLRFGTDKDFIEFPTNGPMAEAAGQAMGCTLPNQWMVDEIDKDAKKNAQFIPFKPQVFSTADSMKMRSPEFIQIHNDHTKKWAAEHGVDLTKPTYGYFKHVVLQSPDQKNHNRLDIYGGYFEKIENGQKTGEPGAHVEPGHVGHDIYHDDYSQQGLFVLNMGYYNGKPRAVRNTLSDQTAANEFGFTVIPEDQAYKLPDWMQEAVAQIKKQQPMEAAPVAVASASASASALPKPTPTPVQTQPQPEPIAVIPTAGAVKAWKPETKDETAYAPSPAKAKSSPTKYEPSYNGAPAYSSPPTGSIEKSTEQPTITPRDLVIKPEKIAEPAPEGLDAPPTIKYTTLGDSLTVGTTDAARGSLVKFGYHTRPSKENPNNPEMVGKQTAYMKGRMDAEVIPSIEKTGLKAIVLGGGGNDILGPLPNDKAMDATEKRVTENLAEMYQKAHNNGLKVVAMTMPPFNRYIEKTFKDPKEKERHYKLWENVNQFIMDQEGKSDGPDKVVKAHELVGTQNADDKRWLVKTEMSAGDGLHLAGEGYKSIQIEIEKALNGIAVEMAEKENKTLGLA